MRKLRSVNKEGKRVKVRISRANAANNMFLESDGTAIGPQPLLLRNLLPTAVKAFFNELADEVRMLRGERYTHGKDGCCTLGNLCTLGNWC